MLGFAKTCRFLLSAARSCLRMWCYTYELKVFRNRFLMFMLSFVISAQVFSKNDTLNSGLDSCSHPGNEIVQVLRSQGATEAEKPTSQEPLKPRSQEATEAKKPRATKPLKPRSHPSREAKKPLKPRSQGTRGPGDQDQDQGTKAPGTRGPGDPRTREAKPGRSQTLEKKHGPP